MPTSGADVLRLAVTGGISGNGSAGVQMIQGFWALRRQVRESLGTETSVDYECYECKSCFVICKSWDKTKSDTYRSPASRTPNANSSANAEAAARRKCD